MIANGEVPISLQNKRVVALDIECIDSWSKGIEGSLRID